MRTVRVFQYIDQLDAFVVMDEYRHLADQLGLIEWNPVVWIGRLFTLDNDYGEHWFDNWDERAALEGEAQKLGIASDQLMIIAPDRFKNDADGPCHTPPFRKQFWTDVLTSLALSYDTLFEAARQNNATIKECLPDEYIKDLEDRIVTIQTHIGDEVEPNAENVTSPRQPNYTPKQGQYLAFIHYYTKLHGQPPAESDMQRHFKVSAPTVHQMILTLEKRGLIERIPGQARTIRVSLPPEALPGLV
jgi:LexA DNA binding domain